MTDAEPVEWLIDYLSTRCAEHPELRLAGLLDEAIPDRKASLAATIRWLLDHDELQRRTWVVETADGKRSRKAVIVRAEFVADWNRAEMAVLWESHVFADRTINEITWLCDQWRKHADFQTLPQFSSALTSAADEVATFTWQDMRRSIRRDAFRAWFKASPFAQLRSGLTGALLVTADDLWPATPDLKGLPPFKAAQIVWKEQFPHGLPDDVVLKAFLPAHAANINDQIRKRGGSPPGGQSHRTHERALTALGYIGSTRRRARPPRGG